jgi:hypothetical protein
MSFRLQTVNYASRPVHLALKRPRVYNFPRSVTVTCQCCRYYYTKDDAASYQATYQTAQRRNTPCTFRCGQKCWEREVQVTNSLAVIDLSPTPFPCCPPTSCLKYRTELHLCCIVTQEWKSVCNTLSPESHEVFRTKCWGEYLIWNTEVTGEWRKLHNEKLS